MWRPLDGQHLTHTKTVLWRPSHAVCIFRLQVLQCTPYRGMLRTNAKTVFPWCLHWITENLNVEVCPMKPSLCMDGSAPVPSCLICSALWRNDWDQSWSVRLFLHMCKEVTSWRNIMCSPLLFRGGQTEYSPLFHPLIGELFVSVVIVKLCGLL